MKTKTIEVFQVGGADETLAEAKAKFIAQNPETFILHHDFEYAFPGNREGRWVGVKFVYT